MNILLVEPSYYTRYPPLGLLKLARYHRDRGDNVKLVRGIADLGDYSPDEIKVTSLFTYSWQPVHEAVRHYKSAFSSAQLSLGGIYATLMPDHAKLSGADVVHSGPLPAADGLLPAYDLVPGWTSGLGFASRGCIRKCPFCAVPRMEPNIIESRSLAHILADGQHKVVFWDNNILGTDHWPEVIQEVKKRRLLVDFNQAMDARLIDEEAVAQLEGVRIRPIRMAYDTKAQGPALARASSLLENVGFRRDRMIVYVLYNFTETPEEFFFRIRELLLLKLVPYPMRYEPLDSLRKNRYVSPHWTATKLEQVAIARRVLGFGGALPPYTGLREKFRVAKNFSEAFNVRATTKKGTPDVEGRLRKWLTPVNAVSLNGHGESSAYSSLMNDPTRLVEATNCLHCGKIMHPATTAFMVVDSNGNCRGFSCADCHPNQKWIWALWRNALTFDHPPVKANSNGRMAVVPDAMKQKLSWASVRS